MTSPPERSDTTSIQLVLDVVRFEREQQVVQFDAIDSKAGTVVGFSAAVLGIIAAVAVTADWVWGLWLLPATVGAAHAVHYGHAAGRIRRIERQEGRSSFDHWVALSPREALKQAVADEIRTLEVNNPVVQEKVDDLKRAWAAFGWTAGLLVAGTVGTVLHRTLLCASTGFDC